MVCCKTCWQAGLQRIGRPDQLRQGGLVACGLCCAVLLLDQMSRWQASLQTTLKPHQVRNAVLRTGASQNLGCAAASLLAGRESAHLLPAQAQSSCRGAHAVLQGMAAAAHLLPVLRFVQAVVHQAWKQGAAATAAQGRGHEESDKAAEVSPREGAALAPSAEGAATSGAPTAASDVGGAAGALAAEAAAAPAQQEQAASAVQAGAEAGAEPTPGSQASGDGEASGQVSNLA